MNAEEFQYFVGMAGTVAFAVTAVLAVTPKGIDLFGACVMGIITAIGGGTIRDLILDVPVFWASDLMYIWVALLSSLVAFQANRFMGRKSIYQAMLYLDGLGVALFSIQGTHKVILLDFGWPLAPVLLGIVTAIGGGLTRDVLAGNTTLLMKHELYAVPVTLGCVLYTVLIAIWPEQAALDGTVSGLFIFAVRAAAIHWKIALPHWATTQPNKE